MKEIVSGKPEEEESSFFVSGKRRGKMRWECEKN